MRKFYITPFGLVIFAVVILWLGIGAYNMGKCIGSRTSVIEGR